MKHHFADFLDRTGEILLTISVNRGGMFKAAC